jgi:hypothetical protein
MCCEWTEAVGQKSDRLDQGDVIGRSHGREEGKADGDRASEGEAR